MTRQKEQARAAGKFKGATNVEYSGASTDFKGYETLETTAKVFALYKNGTSVSRMDEGDAGHRCAFDARRFMQNLVVKLVTTAC